MPWKSGFKCDGPPSSYFDLDLDGVVTLDKIDAGPSRAGRPDYHVSLKGKGRSHSAPITPSVFDIIPATDLDTFAPLPFVILNLFDECLPRELRLQVLSSLVTLHEADHELMKREGRWTVSKAATSRYKWVGRDRGTRELVKFSRVSKAWRDLVFDGQLWTGVNLCAFPKLPAPVLLRLSKSAGSFIRNIDFAGHTSLTPATLAGVAENLCLQLTPRDPYSCTQLTAINLQGCSILDARAIHEILARSPLLSSLSLKGLDAVTNITFQVLAACPLLTSLNMSRCPNINADGLLSFCRPAVGGTTLRLKELRLSGMTGIYDDVLATLGQSAPLLEVLDLSYCRSLHNSALEAFVACSADDESVDSIWLNAREAGRDTRNGGRYRRRITNIRHLALSNCVMLTDIACSNLAHTMPKLELLELAGIGPELKDEGLVRLLKTTPLIRKLDLEDAYEISDVLLASITPDPGDAASGVPSVDSSQSGHALEHLIVSYALNLTNEAFSSLIHNCPKIRVLEADGTHISASVLRNFVRLARSRQLSDAELVVVDCRAVGESVVKEVSASTRPRKGWRSWHARKLGYFDAQDGEELNLKPSQRQDECDEKRVVLKSFYNWQTVDAVRAARERKRKSSRKLVSTNNSDGEEGRGSPPGRTRWWSPSGRRSSGTNTPGVLETVDRDGCTIM
ncbi:RNI-like protein [Coniophora puteana RWD-64-598 SS2]|uniref:RNI-like protein n=1 Tax=Coniophora puteana (strain RWD-64-598) TaxID=741705 RepID=A0A5M3N774_CONPW|nr:RNI-like protein [Coniophora puteana RWD-64-598 SS2]EIW87138.1 RNI-like protein [Coniophora puteana RWD-64-598 SS2]